MNIKYLLIITPCIASLPLSARSISEQDAIYLVQGYSENGHLNKEKLQAFTTALAKVRSADHRFNDYRVEQSHSTRVITIKLNKKGREKLKNKGSRDTLTTGIDELDEILNDLGAAQMKKDKRSIARSVKGITIEFKDDVDMLGVKERILSAGIAGIEGVKLHDGKCKSKKLYVNTDQDTWKITCHGKSRESGYKITTDIPLTDNLYRKTSNGEYERVRTLKTLSKITVKTQKELTKKYDPSTQEVLDGILEKEQVTNVKVSGVNPSFT